jgi:hypothetical protein
MRGRFANAVQTNDQGWGGTYGNQVIREEADNL